MLTTMPQSWMTSFHGNHDAPTALDQFNCALLVALVAYDVIKKAKIKFICLQAAVK
jgi:hypothetical protein